MKTIKGREIDRPFVLSGRAHRVLFFLFALVQAAAHQLFRTVPHCFAVFRLVGELNAKCNQAPEEAEKRAIELRNENMSKLFLPNNREFMPDMGLANINPHLFLRNEVYNHFTKE